MGINTDFLSKKELWRRRVSERELNLFCEQFSVMMSSGMPMVECLEVMGKDHKNRGFGQDILGVGRRVRQGHNLWESAALYPKSFPPIFIKMVRSGEAGGSLDKILRNLRDYYKGQADIKSNLFHALLYPIIVTLVAFVVVIFLVSRVIPIFVTIFDSMEAEVPQSTQILLRISGGLAAGWPFILLAMVALTAAVLLANQNPGFVLKRDGILLRLPGYGQLIYYMESLRMADVLSILLGNGVDLLSALEVVNQVIGNGYFRAKMEEVRQGILKGKSFADCLVAAQLFEADFSKMVRVGEESGTLDEVLAVIAAYYQDKTERGMKTFTTVIEPVILVLVGLMVMFIIASVMTPVYDLYEGYAELL